MPPNFIQFTIQAVDPPGPQVSVGMVGAPSQSRRGGSSASAASGGGSWQIVDRARGRAATEWVDYNPMVMSFSLIAEGYGGSVEDTLAIIESYELPAPGTQPPRPPIVQIGGPVPHAEAQWVVSALSFPAGEDVQVRNDLVGFRTTQHFTLELTEYSPTVFDVIQGLSPAEQAAAALQANGSVPTTVPAAPPAPPPSPVGTGGAGSLPF